MVNSNTILCTLFLIHTSVCAFNFTWHGSGVGSPLPVHAAFERVGAECPPGHAASGLRFRPAGCNVERFWTDGDVTTPRCDIIDEGAEGLVAELRCSNLGLVLEDAQWLWSGIGAPLASHHYFDRVGALCPTDRVVTGIKFERGGSKVGWAKWTEGQYDPTHHQGYNVDDQALEGLLMVIKCAIPAANMVKIGWTRTGIGAALNNHVYFDRVGGECASDSQVAQGFSFERGGCGADATWADRLLSPLTCSTPMDTNEGLYLLTFCTGFTTHSASPTPTHYIGLTITPSHTPSPTPVPTFTHTPTLTPVPTDSRSQSKTPTFSPISTVTLTNTPTATATSVTPTRSFSPTHTPTPTNTPTRTSSQSIPLPPHKAPTPPWYEQWPFYSLLPNLVVFTAVLAVLLLLCILLLVLCFLLRRAHHNASDMDGAQLLRPMVEPSERAFSLKSGGGANDTDTYDGGNTECSLLSNELSGPLITFETQGTETTHSARTGAAACFVDCVVAARWKITDKELGHGGFAFVLEGEDQTTRERVAVKAFAGVMGKREERQLLREVGLLGSITHPNVVRLLGHEVQRGMGSRKGVQEMATCYIVLELMPNGTLEMLRLRTGPLLSHPDPLWMLDFQIKDNFVQRGELLLCRFGLEMASALAYLHENRVIHYDLKPHNVLLDKMMHCRIADFGLSRAVSSTMSAPQSSQTATASLQGTLAYMAPELLQAGLIAGPNSIGTGSGSGRAGAAADIWAWGLTLLRLASPDQLWSHASARHITALMVHIATVGAHPIPEAANLSPALADLLRRCLRRRPSERPTAVQLMAHPALSHENDRGETLGDCIVQMPNC
eukprot:TRINITY_DN8372_c0_g1_i1.p1 TRINITY_DN8372_c0_g1~~TRINITY_DN8372_c0_g1_i1.p1  ORF type:complete len:836 (-),score=51.12 TRINITY_DN8372_c0_g1_i1:81-2588(-)